MPEVESSFSPLVVVKPAEGKGKGLFTTRKVQAGEILLREKPLLSVEHENEEPPCLDAVCDEFHKLNIENQKKILCLRTRHPAKLDPKGGDEKYTEFEKTFFANNIAEDDEVYTELEKIIGKN